ncbi:MAG: hypothetical protein NWF05_07660 [Candidatus Bathyarchaeota archaeon]|nr:hypothetical protein [Candidatus Bathyarchaeota archaeon]
MSSQTENRIQILTRLGLTQYQGKVFLMLVQLVTATAKDIARESGVPRPKVYEALEALQEIGIITKVMTAPTTFEAIPLSDARSFLLKRKLKEYQNLRVEVSSLLRDLGQKQSVSGKKDSKIVLVSDKEAIVGCIQRLVENTKCSVDLVTSWKWFSKIPILSNALVNAQNRGAKIRVVVQRPVNGSSINDIISSIKTQKLIEYRTIPFAPSAITVLYDERHALICTEADAELKNSPTIVTDNSCLVEVTKVYFQKMWQTSQPYIEKSVQKEPPDQTSFSHRKKQHKTKTICRQEITA